MDLGGTDGVTTHLTWTDTTLHTTTRAHLEPHRHALYLALGARHDADSPGAPHVPAQPGALTLLPFHASHILIARLHGDGVRLQARTWGGVAWGPLEDAAPELACASRTPDGIVVEVERHALGRPAEVDIAAFLRDLHSPSAPGAGWIYGATDPRFTAGPGVGLLHTAHRVDLGTGHVTRLGRMGRALDAPRPRVYQLLVRSFGNTRPAHARGGPIAESGCGTFEDIDARAIDALTRLGVTHVWLTGVLNHATSTDYSAIGLPASDPDLLKGRAGSPYAVRDAFDLCPDLARDPARRLEAFRALIDRLHAREIGVLIDCIPNHVARCYRSTLRADLDFGRDDDPSVFYARDNHFFYLQLGEGPLTLPGVDPDTGEPVSETCRAFAEDGDPDYQCDGRFDWAGQRELHRGRVTGNNLASWSPDLSSWYETVKLNYGFDFTTRTHDHPRTDHPRHPIPSTWRHLDAIIAHWQGLGVDGFRVDMAHMVPPAFHAWLIARARAREPHALFIAEAYDSDPAKVTDGDVHHALLAAGYDAVYDDASYDTLKDTLDGARWANDLVDTLDPIRLHLGLRYAENHDEVRLAAPAHWAGAGRTLGPAVTAVLHGLGRGPTLLYAGQETGEAGEADGRTSLFEYGSMASFAPFARAGFSPEALDPGDARLYARYQELFAALEHPLFARGETVTLRDANLHNPRFGRGPGERVSGHRGVAFLRHEGGGEALLVFAWLDAERALDDVRVQIPTWALDAAGLDAARLDVTPVFEETPTSSVRREALAQGGLPLGAVEPGGVRMVSLRG